MLGRLIVVVPACAHIVLTRRTSFGSGRNRCASLNEWDRAIELAEQHDPDPTNPMADWCEVPTASGTAAAGYRETEHVMKYYELSRF